MQASATFWDKAAEKYAAQPVEDPGCFDRKIAATLALMRPDSTILDVGCGTGSLALRLAGDGARVHGLDVSREMVRIARDKAAAQQADDVTFHVGPFNDDFAAFEPGSLDGICAYSILHLVPDRHAALRRAWELLAPGGFLVASTVCLRESRVPYRPLLTVMRWLGKAPRVTSLSKRGLADDVRRAGFVDVTEPDVGAKPIISFLAAKKPA